MHPARVATVEVPGATLHYEVRGVRARPADHPRHAGRRRVLRGRGPPAHRHLDGGGLRPAGHVPQPSARPTGRPTGRGPRRRRPPGPGRRRPGTRPRPHRQHLRPGLELAASHPEQVRTLVAFEPPLTELLPDRERWRTFYEDLHATYGRDGLGPALQKFAAEVGLEGQEPPQGDADPEVTASIARMGGNMDLWLSHVIRPSFLAYTPDIPRLRAGPTRIVAVIGDASRPHQLAHQTTHALAARLGTTPVAVPGDHEAVTSRPAEFTAVLRRLLDGGRQRRPPGG
jgi:hypothetical protein